MKKIDVCRAMALLLLAVLSPLWLPITVIMFCCALGIALAEDFNDWIRKNL